MVWFMSPTRRIGSASNTPSLIRRNCMFVRCSPANGRSKIRDSGQFPAMNFVTHLECANCGLHYDATQIHNLCTSCQRPLWVRYDLAALKKSFSKKTLFGRPPTLWRYLEMLPVHDPSNIVSLTETITPILETKRL